MSQATKYEEWEKAWSEYIDALSMHDVDIQGEDFVFWVGVSGRRLSEAKCRLRFLDPDFCKTLGV